MSTKERIAELLDTFSEEELAHVLAMVLDYRDDLDDTDTDDDEAYDKLHEEYESDPDRGQFISFEDLLASYGMSVEDLEKQ